MSRLFNLIQFYFGLCLLRREILMSLSRPNIDGIVISLSTWSTFGLFRLWGDFKDSYFKYAEKL